MARADDPWLVKSSGRIIGPFPSVKIMDLLRSREISVLDEVASPLRRWQTIQYHPEFKESVASLRRANVSDKTEASWTPGTVTGGLTQTMTDISGEITQEVTQGGFTTTKEIVIHNVSEEPTGNAPPPAARFQTQQAQNTAIQRKVEKTTRGLWLITVVVLLVVAAFIVQKRFGHGFESRMSYPAFKLAVMTNVQTGQYADALRELKSYYPDANQAGEMAIYYGALMIQVEGQTVVGRRLLNSVITNHRPEIKQAYTGLGLADLIEGQLDSAHDNLERALAVDPNYVPALVNSAITALQKGDAQTAKTIAQKALSLAPTQAEALLALAEAQLGLVKAGGKVSEVTPVSEAIAAYRAKQWDYAAELGLFSIYFSFLRQDRSLDEKLRDYLDTDPQLTADHRHNVFIYRGHAQWKNLVRLCEPVAERLQESPRASAFLASCYSHEGRWDQARKFIEKAAQQSPKDALIQSWLSNILRESGEANQASVVLGHASEFNHRGEYILPTLLQARFCAASDDFECARDSWQHIYEHDLEYLPAVSGLAWSFARKGSRSEALKLLEKGLRISPDYIPLLLLRQKAEKEGWYAAG